MASLSQTVYDGAAIEQFITQRFVGNGALIEAELEKAKQEVEYCKAEGAKMQAIQTEIAKEVIDSRTRMSEAVDFANNTREGIHAMNDGIRLMIEAVEKKHKEIDGHI